MTQVPPVVEDTREAPGAAIVMSEDKQTPPPSPDAGGATPGGAPRAEAVEFASPPGENGDNLDIDYNEDGHCGIRGLTTSSNDKASLVGFVSRCWL
jgi:hypothetical protein